MKVNTLTWEALDKSKLNACFNLCERNFKISALGKQTSSAEKLRLY